MTEFIPKRKADIKSDDIQDIEKDIRKLAFKYLGPVDDIRSIVRPKVSTSKSDDQCAYEVDRDNSRPLESRAHAFLRYIGFPVAVKSGDFYNPGFHPNGCSNDTNRSDINNKFFSANIMKLIRRRENYPGIVSGIFGRQDLSASVYALLLSTSIRPIISLKDGIGSLDIDEQSFNERERGDSAASFLISNENVSKDDLRPLAEIAGPNFTKGIHILKPFIVDPSVDSMAMPINNKIAVPFLKNKEELKVNEDPPVYVLRPGLEKIISERLRGSELIDTVFLENMRKVLKNESSPNTYEQGGTIEGRELKSAVAALLGNYDIDIEEVKELKLTSVQTEIISQLVRTLKAILSVMYDSIIVVLKACIDINWVPIPSPEGPEQGAKNAILRTTNISSENNEIGRVIIKLKRKEISARYGAKLGKDIGEFASPFGSSSAQGSNTNDESLESISNSLKDIEQKRDKIANDAFEAMGNIELIMGEASGFGLIDALSIYIALWSMDEKSLVSLLDNEAFNRLKTNFPALIKGAAADRNQQIFNKGPEIDIETALDNFESKLKNVQNFAQIEFERKFVTDGEEAGADIYADS